MLFLQKMSWLRAVWMEDGSEVEGVIPSIWREGSVVRWPLKNPLATAKCSAQPSDDWMSFDLIKIKFSSGNMQFFIKVPSTLELTFNLISHQHIL
jgi:hypothetical protein